MVPGFLRLRPILTIAAIVLLSACTSVHTYGLDQVGPEVPIEAGDAVTLHLNDAEFSAVKLVVTDLDERSIRGELEGSGASARYAWNEISRIETRKPDGARTTGLVVGLLLLGWVLVEAGEGLDDVADAFGD